MHNASDPKCDPIFNIFANNLITATNPCKVAITTILFYSIIYFYALNLCRADSKVQHKNPVQKIIVLLPSPVPQRCQIECMLSWECLFEETQF